jgi:Tfp pilus assembly protein PilF
MTEKEVADLFSRAIVNQDSGSYMLAVQQLTKVLMERPDFPFAWDRRGTCLQKFGHPFDAVMNYDRAVELAPEAAGFINNRGTAYTDLELFDKAIEQFDLASVKNPKLAQPKNNKGIALMRQCRIEEALTTYREAAELDPSYADAHLGVAFAALKLGQYEEGWKEFEWRWHTGVMNTRNLPLPEWHGERAANPDDGLLLYGEQGFGDVLQFMRYASVAKMLAWHGKVYLEVRHPIQRIAQTMKGVDGVITFGERIPPNVTTCSPIGSMPRLLWPIIESIPSKCPYITPDPYRSSIWRERLKDLPEGKKIGLCWAGMNRGHVAALTAIDARRSMTLQDFAPLGKIKGISWVSLQTGAPLDQIKEPPAGMTIGEWSSDFSDFFDTAALVDCLDLVITVDTAVAHLAGALGKPVWLLSRFDGCWRWGLNRENTAWYPSMRIFNQKQPNEWAETVDRVAVELRKIGENNG